MCLFIEVGCKTKKKVQSVRCIANRKLGPCIILQGVKWIELDTEENIGEYRKGISTFQAPAP